MVGAVCIMGLECTCRDESMCGEVARSTADVESMLAKSPSACVYKYRNLYKI